ncbi:MAG: ATP-grasp domain-containing protein, partial [Burkholderiaceae bacterium]|nr:ATP-grasp domain-containing protein [Burkholderiaceae bacterium]
FLHAIGYRHGFFNLEFFFDARSDRLTVIECNPRLASQFGDLYRRVQGVDAHAMALALALGDDPQRVACSAPTAGAAASLVYRAFRAQDVPPMPGTARRRQFAQRFADGLLFCQPKRGHALARDFKWTGSHRYGVVHLGAADRESLRDRALQASALIGWPAPYFADGPAAQEATQAAPRTRRPRAAHPALETS